MNRKVFFKAVICTLLIISIGLLSSLIPGGPIENRDFSHLSPSIILGFNIFLACLLLASVATTALVWAERARGNAAALLVGMGYFLVYVLDLAEIFPVSPTPMSQALYFIEVSGLIVAIILILITRIRLQSSERSPDDRVRVTPTIRFPISLTVALGLIAIGAVAFATNAARQPGGPSYQSSAP